jgi:hypothetical protein
LQLGKDPVLENESQRGRCVNAGGDQIAHGNSGLIDAGEDRADAWGGIWILVERKRSTLFDKSFPRRAAGR